MTLRLLAAALVGLAGAAVAPVGASDVEHKLAVAEAGPVRAVVRYLPFPHDYGKRPRLRIVRNGSEVFAEYVASLPRHRGRVIVDGLGLRPLLVRNLDGVGDPEVMLRLYSGGNRCCVWTRVYRFDARKRRYEALNHYWGNIGERPRIRDLNRDGRPEFVSSNWRFAYVSSSTFYIGAIQIWAYRRGAFMDVTRRFPRAIRRDAGRMWWSYLGADDGAAARHWLAAWVGDQYLLGHRRRANAALGVALRRGRLDIPPRDLAPPSRVWVAQLKSFLVRNGY